MIGVKRFFLWGFAVTATFIFSQCTAPLCEEKGNIELNAGFYTKTNSIVADTLVDSISVTLGANLDTIYYEELKSGTQKLAFPLSITSDTSKVVIQFDQSVSDTLTFICKRELRMISHECGFVYFFELVDVENTTNKINSVWIDKELVEYSTEEQIKNGIAENIKIYL